MARQHGNSRRGPEDLDRAVRDQGRSGQSLADDDAPSGSMSAGSGSQGSDDPSDGAYATDEYEISDTDQLHADGELEDAWSADDEDTDAGGMLAGEESAESWSARDEGSDESDDRSMRAHGADRDRADGQHGNTRRDPGSGPRHR